MNNSTSFNSTSQLKPEPPSNYILYHSSLVTMMSIVLTVDMLGACANLVTFIATITYPPLRKSSSCLLLAQCIFLDFIVSLIIQPGNMLMTYFGSRQFPPLFCPAWGMVLLIFNYANNWSHAVLAMNRFVAVVFVHQYRHFTTKVMLGFGAALPWLVSLGLNVIPVLQGRIHMVQTKGWGACLPPPGEENMVQLFTTTGTYVPCGIVGISYVIILVKARVELALKVGEVGKARNSVLEKRYEMSKMLFLCFAWFCVTNFAITLSLAFWPKEYFGSPKTQLAFKGVLYVYNAVNPVLFLLISRNYRDGCLAVLKGQTKLSLGGLERNNTDKSDKKPSTHQSQNND